MKYYRTKYISLLISFMMISAIGVAQQTEKSNQRQQDKTLIKKQSGDFDNDRAAFIKQFSGNQEGSEFIYSRDQRSSGASLLRNGDQLKYDMSKIRQIDSENRSAYINDGAIGKQYSRDGKGNIASQSKSSSGFQYIEQFGNDNSVNHEVREKSNSYTSQFGSKNNAEVKMKNGSKNQSRILQTEDKNRANIKQENSGHNAIINQYKGENNARISQSGSQNWVDIDQSKGSELDIKQSGSKNVIRGTRSSWAESLNGSILEIEQFGSNNQVDLQQNGSKAELKQKGTNNKTTIIQK